jgi:hypothetical protein
MAAAPTQSRLEEQREFLTTYWNCLMVEHDWGRFREIVHPQCVVHYPGNHFLSGDHIGRDAVVRLYQNLTKLGPATGTFRGELHDTVYSEEHCCALVKYWIVVGPNMEIPGDAVGVFHLEDGMMREYWLLERDQKMINDIINMGGKALLAGGAKKDMAKGAATHPLCLGRTVWRVARIKRGKNTKML